jgi:hypothetical protein
MGIQSQISGLVQLDEIARLIETTEEDAYRYFAGKIKKEWKDVLIAMNIDNMELGIRPDLSQITKTPVGKQQNDRYERYTVYLKSKRGDLQVSEDSPVTLEDTGEFRMNIDIVVGSNQIIFIDRDPKSEKIEATWGKVLGITDEQIREFSEIIYEDFKQWSLRRFKRLGGR